MSHTATLLALAAGLSVAVANLAAPAVSQGKAGEEEAAFATPTFADVAALTEKASLVVLVEVRDQAVVKPERAPGLAPGYARLYIEGRTQALLGGRAALGESLVYLADVPLDEDGDALVSDAVHGGVLLSNGESFEPGLDRSGGAPGRPTTLTL